MICKCLEFLDVRQTFYSQQKVDVYFQFDVETKVVSLYIYTKSILGKGISLNSYLGC